MGFQKCLGFRAGGYGLSILIGFYRAACSGLHKPGRNLVFLRHENIRVLGLWNDHNRVPLNLGFEICRAGDIIQSRPKWHIRKRQGDRIGGVRRIRGQFENNVDALARRIGLGVIQLGRAFAEEPQSLNDRGICKVDARNNDFVEFVAESLRAADRNFRLLNDGGRALGEFADRQLPGFLHLHKQVATGFAVGGFSVSLPRVVDAFHQFPGGDVVFIHIQRLLAAFESQVVAARGKEPLAFLDQFFDLFHLRHMSGRESSAIGKTFRVQKLRA